MWKDTKKFFNELIEKHLQNNRYIFEITSDFSLLRFKREVLTNQISSLQQLKQEITTCQGCLKIQCRERTKPPVAIGYKDLDVLIEKMEKMFIYQEYSYKNFESNTNVSRIRENNALDEQTIWVDVDISITQTKNIEIKENDKKKNI